MLATRRHGLIQQVRRRLRRREIRLPSDRSRKRRGSRPSDKPPRRKEGRGERHCLTRRMRQLLERDKVGAATVKRKKDSRSEKQNLEEGNPPGRINSGCKCPGGGDGLTTLSLRYFALRHQSFNIVRRALEHSRASCAAMWAQNLCPWHGGSLCVSSFSTNWT